MDQQLPKPADVLLHYNYGAAVVKQWGKNSSVLTNCPDVPHPFVPIPDDHNTAIQKWAAAVSQGGQGARSEGGATDFEVQDKWDEDDLMLFFWSNSKGGSRKACSGKARAHSIRRGLEDYSYGKPTYCRVVIHQQTVEMAMSHYVTLQKLWCYVQRDLCYRSLQTNLNTW